MLTLNNKYLFFDITITQGLPVPFPPFFLTSSDLHPPLHSSNPFPWPYPSLPYHCSFTPHFFGWRISFLLIQVFLRGLYHRILHPVLQIIAFTGMPPTQNPQGMEGCHSTIYICVSTNIIMSYCNLLLSTSWQPLRSFPSHYLKWLSQNLTITPHPLFQACFEDDFLQNHKENEATRCELLNFNFFLFPPTL